MGAEAMQEYKQDQRVAICMGAWRDAHGDQGQKPKPKAAYGSCPMPDDGESQAHYMGRCVAGGDAHADCLATWQDHQQGKSVASKSAPHQRFYSFLEVKGINEGERSIAGIASTPSTDHVGDIVESTGAKYKLPIPLLWQHRHDSPVGEVVFAENTPKGIPFRAKIAKIEEPGELKNLTDKAWQAVKARLVKGVSIGFSPIDYEMIKGGVRFKEWAWHELSLVTVPANADATISLIRSLDTEAMLAANGQGHSNSVVKNPAGVTAANKNVVVKPEGKVPTIQEDIVNYANTRAAKAAKMQAMMSKASEDGTTLDQAQEQEYDELEAEIQSLDKHLDRLRKQEKLNIASAVPVQNEVQERHVAPANGSAGRVPVTIKGPPLPKGTAFTRYVIALGMAKGNLDVASKIAQRDQWKDTPEVASVLNHALMNGTTEIIKAPVAEGNTYNNTWAGALVQYQYMTSEFIDLLRPQTILGRLNGFRRVPFNIRIPLQTAGATAYWVGEGSVKPMSSLAFDTTTMGFSKVAALVAFTQELLRFSNPSIEELVRQDLIATCAQFLDTSFLDPTRTAGTGTGGPSPASVTNGAPSVIATGTDADAARADIGTTLRAMAALNLPMASGVWVMGVQQAISFSLMLNALGQKEFPDITANGGTLLGFPVITSENVPASGGSPADGHMMVFLLPSEILLADDGNVSIDMSTEASLQMESAPDSPATASTVMVSLWQRNMVALRAEREINWMKRRTGVVSYIDYAKYA
jgi:HK97 family phage major capsid protein/HK97 family phage prohead protease